MRQPSTIASCLSGLILTLLFAVINTGLCGLAQAQTFKVLYRFTAKNGDGGLPNAVTLDASGNIYGTTTVGGRDFLDCADGCGNIYRLTPSGNETILYIFGKGRGGAQPAAGVVRDSAGNLYGTSQGGTSNALKPTLYKLDPNGTFTVLHTFGTGKDGTAVWSGVLLDSEGNLFGTTSAGGDFNEGTAYKMDAAGNYSVLTSFHGGYGTSPSSELIRDSAGNLYGTAAYGGNPSCVSLYNRGCGVIFKLDPLGKETVLYTFKGAPDGEYPNGLIGDAEGSLYGTTQSGGTSDACPQLNGCGTVFRLDASGVETVLYSFSGGADGATPYSKLLRDKAGTLYGTTLNGGTAGYGTVFKVDVAGGETVLHSFLGGTDGESPYSPLIPDAAGNLYGTTDFGGDLSCLGGWSCGEVYRLTPQ